MSSSVVSVDVPSVKLTAWMDRVLYPDFGNGWDNVLFRDEILAYLKHDHVVLDLGAGAGIVRETGLRGRVRRVCGVDLDRRVLGNSLIDEAKVADAEAIPYPDSTFDLAFSNNVFEHLERPLQVLRELARVIKPGGIALIKTPNRWHYMPLIARLTPQRFHRFYNRLRGRAENDTFPTRYAANSPRVMRRMAEQAGLTVEHIHLIEGRPEYLRLLAATYVVGVAYERLVNRFAFLAPFRIVMIAVLRKPCRLSHVRSEAA